MGESQREPTDLNRIALQADDRRSACGLTATAQGATPEAMPHHSAARLCKINMLFRRVTKDTIMRGISRPGEKSGRCGIDPVAKQSNRREEQETDCDENYEPGQSMLRLRSLNEIWRGRIVAASRRSARV